VHPQSKPNEASPLDRKRSSPAHAGRSRRLLRVLAIVGRSALGAVVALALASQLTGCGKTVPPATQRVKVRSTLSTFMRELAAANGKVACEGLTAAGQDSLIRTIGPELGNFGIETCAQVVQVTGFQLTAKVRRELASVTVGAVSLHGSTATVQWAAITSPAGNVASFFGHPTAVKLADVDGFWEISSF
jgi:hypothetical protein